MSRAKKIVSMMSEMDAGVVTKENTPEVQPVTTAAAPVATPNPTTAAPAEPPKNPTPDSEIKTGAKVEIIAGEMQGMVANVVAVRGDKVDLKVGQATKIDVPIQNVKATV